MADNNCTTCPHKAHPDGGHCYMFREEPAYPCMQHPERKPKMPNVSVAVAMALAAGDLDLAQIAREAGL